MYSPDRLSLMVSTPYLRNMRTALRISSGPLTTQPKLNLGERQVRQRLVAEPTRHRDLLAGGEIARARDLARRRWRCGSRTSSRGLAVAAPTQDVQPMSR